MSEPNDQSARCLAPIAVVIATVLCLAACPSTAPVATTISAQAVKATKPASIKIATFNIQVFGKTKAGKPEITAKLVEIVRKYDVVAVQEIKDVSGQVPRAFLKAINDGGKHVYKMALSPRTGQQDDDKSSQEQYAFYYRSETLERPSPGQLFPDDASDLFQREPWVAKFRVKKTKTSFTLVNIHTRPKSALAEIKALAEVVAWAKRAFYEPRVIVLGDFNAGCSYARAAQLDELAIAKKPFVWVVPHDADTTVGGTSCAYDRIVMTAEAAKLWSGKWGVDQAFTDKRVSDHWPVWAVLGTKGS